MEQKGRYFTQDEFQVYIDRATLNGTITATHYLVAQIESAAVGLFQAGVDESAGTLRDMAGDIRTGYLLSQETLLGRLQGAQAAVERKEGILATTFDTNLAVDTLE